MDGGSSCSGVESQLFLNSVPVQQLEFKSKSKIFNLSIVSISYFRMKKRTTTAIEYWLFHKDTILSSKVNKRKLPKPTRIHFPILNNVVRLSLSFLYSFVFPILPSKASAVFI